MKYQYIRDIKKIRKQINDCSGHIQQVAFSVHYDALTQICFGCGVIRSNIIKDYCEVLPQGKG